jgi:iron complex transport system substrate-binding protein
MSYTIRLDSMLTDHTPQRVVSLQPSATLILASIGKLDHLVACTKYCADVCPEVVEHGCAIIEDSWTAHAGEITAVNPDLVIASVPYQEKSVIEILRSGTSFLGFAPKNLEGIYKDIAAVAGVMGVPERGETVIAAMQSEIQSVRQAVTPSVPCPRVFCEEWGKPIIASQRWVAELVEAAGGEFVGIPGVQTTSEAVLAANPDVFVVAWCGAGDRVPLEKIIHARGWEEMRAVREGRVYCIRDEYLNTPAPSLVRGLRALAAAIHPACFPQADGIRCIRDPLASEPRAALIS